MKYLSNIKMNHRLLVIVAVFAVTGSALLLYTRAAPNAFTVEAEAGDLAGPAAVISDASASGQSAVLLSVSVTPSPTLTPISPTPTPPPTSAVPHGSVSLWKGDMEEGNMNDWFYPTTQGGPGTSGGGIYDSDGGTSAASTDTKQDGSWSAKSVLPSGSGGTRLFRWLESRANREAYYSAWVYIPQAYTLTADPASGQFWLLMQFKSRSADNTRNDPVWGFYVNKHADGQYYLNPGWGWGGTQLAGPTAADGVSGKHLAAFSKPLPTGQWVLLEAYLHQSKDFDGQLTFWQNGEQMVDLQNIRTGYNNCNYNAWCASNEWSVNLYSDGLSPAPAVMYVDNAEIRK